MSAKIYSSQSVWIMWHSEVKNSLRLSLNWDYRRCLHTQGLYFQGISRMNFPTLYKRKTENYLEESLPVYVILVIITSLSLPQHSCLPPEVMTLFQGVKTQWLYYIVCSQIAWPWILDLPQVTMTISKSLNFPVPHYHHL